MKIAILISYVFLSLTVFSQTTSDYDTFYYYDKENGLSQNSVLAIEQDHQGFLWIGTREGLNKFDGHRFITFKNDPKDSTSLSNNRITSLEKGDDGVLWIGTKEGINRYDTNTRKITKLDSITSKLHLFNQVGTICKMKNRNVWFGSYIKLITYNPKTSKFTLMNLYGDGFDLPEKFIISKIFQDSDDTIWIGTNHGLYIADRVNETSIRLKKIVLKDTNSKTSDPVIKDIIEDTHKNLWIGSENQGLLKLDLQKNKLKKYENELLSSIEIGSLSFDENKNLWIACYSGLFILKKDGRIIHPKNKNKAGDIIGDGLNTVFTDREGAVWAGGYFGGLRVWHPSFSTFKTINNLAPKLDVTINLANKIVEDPYQNKYVGTKKNGIVVFDKTGNIDVAITKKLTTVFKGLTVKDFRIEKNFLWIATLKNGIYVYDIIKQEFIENLVATDLQNDLKKTRLYALAKRNNKLFLGTLGDGLIIYDLHKKSIHKLPYELRAINNDNVTLGNITALHLDKKQNLWIASMTGLKRISKENIANESFSYEKISLQLPKRKENIYTITENKNGNILVGTGGNLFMLKDQHVEKIDFSNQGYPISHISGIVPTGEETLWISCEKGVIKFNLRTKTTRLFDQNQELLKSEFRDHSFLHSEKGQIFFGTTTGILHFNPENIADPTHNQKVLLTAIKIEDQNDGNITEYKTIDQISQKGMELDPNQNSFTIQFSSLNYTKITNDSYEYRLLGLSDTWKLTTNPEVTYTLQNPGNYEFQVRTASTTGDKKNQITSFIIYFKTPFWKSGYAILFYIIFGFIVMYSLYHILRSKTELQHQLQLENLEKKRQKEKFASQIEFFTNLSHDFRTPLTLILTPLNQLLEKYQGSSVVYGSLLGIRRNADHLLTLINQLLDFRKIDAQRSQIIFTENDIVESIRNVYLSFQDYAKLEDYNYTFTSSIESTYIYYDRSLIERVFFNLISNAFKNTKKGSTINVTIEDTIDEILIHITDNGIGIDPEMVENIFDRFYKISETTAFTQNFSTGTGIGLHIAKKSMDIHKGSITVESSKTNGSDFLLVLKKGTEHLDDIQIEKRKTFATKPEQWQTWNEVTINETEVEHIINRSRNLDTAKPVVLIVEDNDELRKYIADILKQTFTVEQSKDGIIGFSKAIQKKVDLIISDVMMPRMNGIEFCSKIKNDSRTGHIPVMLLTSRSSELHKIEGLESGADAYLTKPFVVKEFLLTIHNILNTKERYKEQLKQTIDTTLINDNEITIASEDEKLHELAMKVVKENIGNSDFDVNEFSSQVGINRTKLFRKIKEWTGQTPKEFIQFIRLKKASELLERGDLNISTIGYQVGFASPHYFARIFKKQFKQTPREYANKFQQK